MTKETKLSARRGIVFSKRIRFWSRMDPRVAGPSKPVFRKEDGLSFPGQSLIK